MREWSVGLIFAWYAFSVTLVGPAFAVTKTTRPFVSAIVEGWSRSGSASAHLRPSVLGGKTHI